MKRSDIFKIITLVVLVVGLAAATILLPQRQQVGEKAAFGNMTVSLLPSTRSTQIGTDFTVQMMLTTAGGVTMRVSAYDIKMTFNRNGLVIKNFVPDPKFPTNLTATDYGNATGVGRFIALSSCSPGVPCDLPVVSATQSVTVGTLTVSGKALGTFPMQVLKDQSTIAGQNNQNLDVSFVIAVVNNGNYTISAIPTLTPIPTSTPKPTNTPIPTATPTKIPPTSTPTSVPPTSTPKPTATMIPTPTATMTPKPTNTPIPTATYTPTPSRVPTPTPIPCPRKTEGDADCNGKIDIIDFETWRRELLGIDTALKADFDGSGKVDMSDFGIWRAGFLATP